MFLIHTSHAVLLTITSSLSKSCIIVFANKSKSRCACLKHPFLNSQVFSISCYFYPKTERRMRGKILVTTLCSLESLYLYLSVSRPLEIKHSPFSFDFTFSLVFYYFLCLLSAFKVLICHLAHLNY
jgi:hypothetical protein